MKKNKTLLLSLACVTMLCSCGNSVSLEKAKEHCAANYSQTAVEEKYQSATAKTVTDVKKSEGIFEKFFKAGKTEDETKYPVAIVTDDDLDNFGEDGKFTINGKSLTASGKVDLKELLDDAAEYAKGTATVKNEYNAEGLLTKSTTNMDLTMNYSAGGITISGSLKCSEVTTITYTAK